MKYFFVPIFSVRQRRVRCRFRFIKWRGFHRVSDSFAEGIVYRVWVGLILIVVMVDAEERKASGGLSL